MIQRLANFKFYSMHSQTLTIIFSSQIYAQLIEQLINFLEIHFSHFDLISSIDWHYVVLRKIAVSYDCIYFFCFFIRGKSLTSLYTHKHTDPKKKLILTQSQILVFSYLDFDVHTAKKMLQK